MRRALRWLGRGLVVLVSVVTGLVVIALLALDLGPTREFVRGRVNRLLAGTFTGTLVIDRIGTLRLDRVGGIDVHVLDAQGRRIVTVNGLGAHANWPTMVWDLVWGRPLAIVLDPVTIDQIDARLIDDGSGAPTLAWAFIPRPSSPPSAPGSEGVSSGDEVSISIERLHVRHLWAHGSLASVPVIDAELADLAATFSATPSGLSAQVTGVRVRARALPARLDPEGTLTARIDAPFAETEANHGVADFKGRLASAPSTLHAEFRGQMVGALLHAPAVPASVLREVLPNTKVSGPTSLEARVHGRLPRLDFETAAENEAARLTAKGQISLERTLRISAELVASGVDVGVLLDAAPRTSLSASAHLTLSAEGGALNGDYRMVAAPGRVGAFGTPAVSIFGKLERTARNALTVEGKLRIDEPGAPIDADYRFSAVDGKTTLDGVFAARLTHPRRLDALAGVETSGTLDGRASLDFTTNRLSAQATAFLAPVSIAKYKARSLDIELTATGKLASPEFRVQASARDVAALGRRFTRTVMSASGKLEDLQIIARLQGHGPERLDLRTRLSVKPEVVVHQPRLVLADAEGRVTASARSIRVVAGQVRVEDLEVSGLGDVRASGSFGARRVDARFSVRALDLGRVSRIAGIDLPLERGSVSLDGQVHGPLSDLQGKVMGSGQNLVVGGISGGHLDLDLEVKARRINGSIEGKLGHSELAAQVADVDLPSATFTTERLRALRGALRVKGVIALEELAPALRALGVPIEAMKGRLTLDVQAESPRAGSGGQSLHAKLRTQNLSLVQGRALEGIDIDVNLELDPEADRARLDATLFDRTGTLLVLTGESKLPALGAPDLTARLLDLPLHATLHVPARALETLPRAIRPSLRGVVELDLDAQGSVRDPRLRLDVVVHRLQAREGKHSLEFRASAKCDGSGGNLDARAESMRGGTAELHSSWKGNLSRQLQGASGTPPPLDIDADVELRNFPSAAIPALSDQQVRGPLTASLKLRGLGSDATLQATFDGSGVSVNRLRLPVFKATLRADDRELRATVDVDQNPGSLHAEFRAPSVWGSRWVPQLDAHANARLEVEARQFQLAALSPFSMRYLSTLEGLLDASLSVKLDQGKPTLDGTASLKRGVFQLPQLGQRFTDVAGKFAIKNGEVRIDSVQARGVTGRLTAKGRARVEGIELESASLQVNIKKAETVPVTLEGVVIGDAWGHVDVTYANTHRQGATEIRVAVPKLHLAMSETAETDVQDLDAAPDVRVGRHRVDGRFVTLPLAPLGPGLSDGEAPSAMRVKVHLGNSVFIERGHQLSVQLVGDIELETGTKTRVTGRIGLQGGSLDVSGKQFSIERGVIIFEGDDPSNPTVTATARWDSPAGYIVYADYAGTVKKGKLKLHSEPSLSQDEVLSLLLFGSPEGSLGSSGSGWGSGNSGGDTAAAAVGVAGDTAAKGLNRAISDITTLDVSARVDTSTGSARPELVVQLTPRLTTRVTRALGEPTPGQSPDRTFLTLELRLRRSWALSAMVGDHGGSTLDLIWRRRY